MTNAIAKDTPDRNTTDIVPFSRFFSLFGYALLSLLLLGCVIEGIAYITVSRQKSKDDAKYGDLFQHCRAKDNKPCSSKEFTDVMSSSPVFNSYDWADAFWKDERRFFETSPDYAYEPFIAWRNDSWHSNYVNVDKTPDGYWRRTLDRSETCANKPKKQVWFFGGSTMFGYGLPDSATLPSYIAKLLNTPESRFCFEITNLGVPGYNINQEVLLLMLQLKQGRRPDIVIFLDGVNEAYVGAYSPGIASAHMGLVDFKERVDGRHLISVGWKSLHSIQMARTIVRGILHAPEKIKTVSDSGDISTHTIREDDVRTKSIQTLDNYERNLKQAQMFAAEYNFRITFFWQPLLHFGTKPKIPFEQVMFDNPEVLEQDAGKIYKVAMQFTYEEAELRSLRSKDYIFIGHIFDHEERPIYMDFVHLGPLGNEIVAARIAEEIAHGISR